jgi:hypothetical protein
MRDRSRAARSAEHAMFSLGGTPAMVVRSHRVRGHGVHAHGFHAGGIRACRLELRDQAGGQAVPADLDPRRPVACRHESQRNEHTRRQCGQHQAGRQRSPSQLAEVQTHLPGVILSAAILPAKLLKFPQGPLRTGSLLGQNPFAIVNRAMTGSSGCSWTSATPAGDSPGSRSTYQNSAA